MGSSEGTTCGIAANMIVPRITAMRKITFVKTHIFLDNLIVVKLFKVFIVRVEKRKEFRG